MPTVWSLSKSAAHYRPAAKPEIRCAACRYMFPRLSVGGCRYVRGVIRAGDVCDEFAPHADRSPAGS
jgi:hypothetical protein